MRRLLVLARSSTALVALAALPAVAVPAAAQSFFAGRGLGLVSDPESARSGALGGVTLGLPGSEISWSNPAGAVGLPVPGLLVSFQFDALRSRLAASSESSQTARFPLVIGAFPAGEKWAFTAGFGSFLDQRWAVQQADTLVSGTDSTLVVDRYSSDGGVSRLRLGAAYRIVPGLSAGVGFDLYTGGVQRVAGRIFPTEAEPRCCSARWQYSGVGGLASVDWNPSEALSVSLSGSIGGTLEAEAQDSVRVPGDTARVRDAAADRSYQLPATATLGASGRVAGNTLLAATASWSGWSSLDASVRSQGGSRDTWSVGGGLEWEGVNIAGRPLPLRLGARYRQLPFRWGSRSGLADFTAERAFTAGTGVVLTGGATRADLSLERGRRGAEGSGLSESFWRLGLSVSVLGQ